MKNKTVSHLSTRDKDGKLRRNGAIGSGVIFAGALIIVAACSLMVVNMGNIDSISKICVPFVISGSMLIFFGIFISMYKVKK